MVIWPSSVLSGAGSCADLGLSILHVFVATGSTVSARDFTGETTGRAPGIEQRLERVIIFRSITVWHRVRRPGTRRRSPPLAAEARYHRSPSM